MEPYVNVPPKGCALFLCAMERIKASGQPYLAHHLVLPRVEAFSSSLLLWIIGCIIRIIVVVVTLLLLLLPIGLLLSGGPMLMLMCAIADLGVHLLCGRLCVGLLLVVVGLGDIPVFHLPVLIAPCPSPASVVDDVEHLPVCIVRLLPALGIAANSMWAPICSSVVGCARTSCSEEYSEKRGTALMSMM